MPNPFFRNLFNNRRAAVEAVPPRHTFEDVVLPEGTRRALEQALAQIRKHDLIFHQWGLAERHGTGTGLAFNFAGPPGTGKTICAEAVANALGRPLLGVRYDEMESMWAGETARNVAAVFSAAEEQGAVLFFDEADAIAGRRFATTRHGYEREANAVINVLLRELEEFSGVVIFATNLAANFDPAFERRIRNHIRFAMPGVEEREQIWRVQLHAGKTPLASDVDFRALAERFPASGGDIKNAVLKAALAATTEPGPDAEKRIHQRHFVGGMEEVLAGREVMSQSLFDGNGAEPHADEASTALAQWMQGQQVVEENLSTLAGRLVEVEDALPGVAGALAEMREALAATEQRGTAILDALDASRAETRDALLQVRRAGEARLRIVLLVAVAALLMATGVLLLVVL